MPVLVMHVGRVGMFVFEPGMHMEMRMRLPWWVFQIVLMVVVLIMHVRVCVRHRLVDMLMFMALGDVQPNAQSHQAASQQKLNGDGFSKANNGNYCAEERSRRKICASARGAQMPERGDEKCKAHAVAQKADDACKQSI
jgi:hypothetical protein